MLGLLSLGFTYDGGVVVAATGRDVTLRDPRRTGVLDNRAREALWQLYQAIGTVWGLTEHASLSPAGFSEILDLKTREIPSYLAEYRAAAELWLKRGDDPYEAWFFQQGDAHLRRYVLAEFIELYLANGGFRALGYDNYRGAPGGPFNWTGEPPYRIWESA
jgi:hypothetical protein